MKTHLLFIFALLIAGCGNHQPKPTYDEMLNDVVQDFNMGTISGDSVSLCRKRKLIQSLGNIPILQRKRFTKFILGGYSGEVPPLPIPNREVKLTNADGTAVFPWESR